MGNLKPGQHCTINITYVADLRTEGDAIKFFLPTYIAPRYNPPTERDPVHGGGAVKVADGLTISVAATMASAITAIRCPTHAVSITHTAGSPVAVVTLDAGLTQLDKDFELLVTTAEPHAPRVMVEHTADHGPAAVVSLVPKVKTTTTTTTTTKKRKKKRKKKKRDLGNRPPLEF